jgi:probable phosphoglycerate mutase
LTTLYLIRHAEAEGNLYRRIHGQYNSLITDNGYRQIAALEARFRDVPIDAVYSSDLFRTMTTARAIYVPKGLPLHTRKDLRELSMGDWEDHTWASIARTDPEEMGRFMVTSSQFRAPHGESFGDVRARGVAALLDIAAHHPDQTVAVFAHGTLIRNVLGEIQGISPEDMATLGHSDNTAVTKLTVENGQIQVVYADDNSHLNPAISTLLRQNWWKEGGKPDVNLWFTPLDLKKEADQDFYQHSRADAWWNLYGQLDKYDGTGFYLEARDAWRKDPRSLLAAMSGDEQVGILQLDLNRGAGEGMGYISFLYLTPEQRRQGLGVQLIGKAVSVYRPLGRDKLQLVCSQRNTAALAFYDKYGFRRTGTAPGAYGSLYQLEKYIGYDVQGVIT